MDSENPNAVPPPLAEGMRCGVLTSDRGEITLLYDGDLASPIQWIEYNPAEKLFYIIHENGTPQELGISLTDQVEENLLKAEQVKLLLIKNQKVEKEEIVTIVVQEY